MNFKIEGSRGSEGRDRRVERTYGGSRDMGWTDFARREETQRRVEDERRKKKMARSAQEAAIIEREMGLGQNFDAEV